MNTALTIAGSDSGGGAGIQADLKTFEALGVFGTSAITAITAQNTLGVSRVDVLPPEAVTAQIDAVAADFTLGAVKTGMLATAEIVHAVADAVERLGLAPLVVDPVMVATSGDALLTPEAVDAYRERLMPLATILTPNTHEAEALLGWPVRTLEDARRAAAELREAGAGAVLVKGGHLEGEQDAVDVLADDAGERLYRAERIETTSTHGTGCTLASAIAAYLASGADLRDAVSGAKRYLTEAIRHAPGLGSGNGPVRHLWRLTQL
ncbi:bifunctional hydroxymethylpyrimidine kinase/phosphomethylpyrimidine kinase [Rubricoccus marinus]|uniref:hydroxymethylpyrimidine kinase n=1 Tax=Rubricoccus marinus TaxID=716817 RepID=A0A259TX11_9BACT|nr:bifunctional hydroxymethylpyrimidine kinase/phosphomethylpyrimidine kinase [Rubricoccus marinus]OZC02236.1 bifunctional hydroxymethylpyrimidine kinase/phosphomethylpyrimidine kinase [Rubricoccus marinus]